MSKDSFKIFAKNHPELAKEVLKGNTSWQQLYELYEIYGDTSTIWSSYFTPSITDNIQQGTNTIKDFVNYFKNLDMESVQKGITNIQKTITLLQDIGITNNKTSYNSKPIYKRFED